MGTSILITFQITSLIFCFYLMIRTAKKLFGINRNIVKAKQSIAESNNRLDLLSRENSKLREENEELKGKLKNLGFTEIDLDNLK